MTGLDPKTDKILEIYAIVTDFKLKIESEFHSIINYDESILEKMETYVNDMHTQTGLLEKVRASTKSLVEADVEFARYLTEKFPDFDDYKIIVAGNSVHIDKAFIKSQLTEVDQLLHYRILDVSSFRLLYGILYDKAFKKNPEEEHHARFDVLSSIEEMRYYLSFINL